MICPQARLALERLVPGASPHRHLVVYSEQQPQQLLPGDCLALNQQRFGLPAQAHLFVSVLASNVLEFENVTLESKGVFLNVLKNIISMLLYTFHPSSRHTIFESILYFVNFFLLIDSNYFINVAIRRMQIIIFLINWFG